ncbi:MAG TPA: GxxExxY protein [Chthoniobacteraceae bacterium]|nr:GxxExxY protein [Chthoniobacteraceae bacterium]
MSFTAEDAKTQRAAEGAMKVNDVSRDVIGAAIDVHRELGPGLVEKIYEEALCHELHLRSLRFLRQRSVPVIVDLKAREQVTALDKTQLRSYLRLAGVHLGLIINFHIERLVDGVTRVVNKLAETPDNVASADLHA